LCTGAGDFIITDNSGSDADPTEGFVSFNISGFADVDASTYPVLGTEGTPVLTLNYGLSSAGFTSFGTPFIYAAQDGYTGSPGNALFNANNSLGGGSASLYAGAGTFVPGSGTQVFHCASIAPGDCVGGIAPVPTAPYYLALGIVPAPGVGGGATGDASVIVTPLQTVPDGGSTAALLGSILLGFGILRRKLTL
jgi:hypothetical protein